MPCVKVALYDGNQQSVFKRLHFVEVSQDGQILSTEDAPYSDCHCPDETEREILSALPNLLHFAAAAEKLACNYQAVCVAAS